MDNHQNISSLSKIDTHCVKELDIDEKKQNSIINGLNDLSSAKKINQNGFERVKLFTDFINGIASNMQGKIKKANINYIPIVQVNNIFEQLKSDITDLKVHSQKFQLQSNENLTFQDKYRKYGNTLYNSFYALEKEIKLIESQLNAAKKELSDEEEKVNQQINQQLERFNQKESQLKKELNPLTTKRDQIEQKIKQIKKLKESQTLCIPENRVHNYIFVDSDLKHNKGIYILIQQLSELKIIETLYFTSDSSKQNYFEQKFINIFDDKQESKQLQSFQQSDDLMKLKSTSKALPQYCTKQTQCTTKRINSSKEIQTSFEFQQQKQTKFFKKEEESNNPDKSIQYQKMGKLNQQNECSDKINQNEDNQNQENINQQIIKLNPNKKNKNSCSFISFFKSIFCCGLCCNSSNFEQNKNHSKQGQQQSSQYQNMPNTNKQNQQCKQDQQQQPSPSEKQSSSTQSQSTSEKNEKKINESKKINQSPKESKKVYELYDINQQYECNSQHYISKNGKQEQISQQNQAQENNKQQETNLQEVKISRKYQNKPFNKNTSKIRINNQNSDKQLEQNNQIINESLNEIDELKSYQVQLEVLDCENCQDSQTDETQTHQILSLKTKSNYMNKNNEEEMDFQSKFEFKLMHYQHQKIGDHILTFIIIYDEDKEMLVLDQLNSLSQKINQLKQMKNTYVIIQFIKFKSNNPKQNLYNKECKDIYQQLNDNILYEFIDKEADQVDYRNIFNKIQTHFHDSTQLKFQSQIESDINYLEQILRPLTESANKLERELNDNHEQFQKQKQIHLKLLNNQDIKNLQAKIKELNEKFDDKNNKVQKIKTYINQTIQQIDDFTNQLEHNQQLYQHCIQQIKQLIDYINQLLLKIQNEIQFNFEIFDQLLKILKDIYFSICQKMK